MLLALNLSQKQLRMIALPLFLTGLLTALHLPLDAHAASATLASDAELRTERYLDAPTLSRLTKGSHVDTIKSEAGWVQIRAGANIGWVRASQLIGSGADVAKIASVEGGRSFAGNVMATSGIRAIGIANVNNNTANARTDATSSSAPSPQPEMSSLHQINPASKTSVSNALTEIYAQRDPHRIVSVDIRNAKLKINQDRLDFSVTSSENGYVYLMMLGSDNKSFYMLFPNDIDQDNSIRAGETLRLPRKKWQITVQGPKGTDKMLVVVSESPRDLSVLGQNREGPFLSLPTDFSAGANLHSLLGKSKNTVSGDCRIDSQKPDSAVFGNCPDAFGAAIFEIVEQ